MHKTFTQSEVLMSSPFAQQPSPDPILHPSLSRSLPWRPTPWNCIKTRLLTMAFGGEALTEYRLERGKGLSIYSSPLPALPRFWGKGNGSPPQMHFPLTAVLSWSPLSPGCGTLVSSSAYKPRVRIPPGCTHL